MSLSTVSGQRCLNSSGDQCLPFAYVINSTVCEAFPTSAHRV